MAEDNLQPNTLDLATELTIAWLANANTNASADDVPVFLQKVYGVLSNLETSQGTEEQSDDADYTPAVSVRKSLASKDHIISLIDGKPYKTLRRHLSGHGLNPEEYRERYGLKADYPMVSENYSQARREMAKALGLGRKPGQKMSTAPKKAATPARRGRKPAAT